MNTAEPTRAERAAAWEDGREERARAREQDFIDRVSPLLADTFERLHERHKCAAVTDPAPGEAPPVDMLTRDTLAHAIAGTLLLYGACIEDTAAVRDFILWEPLGRGVGFDLAGFARWAERKAP